MKRILSSISILCLCIAAMAQTNFRHITFDEAKAAAKAEQKLLFMDFYTDWCGPCKVMANTIFPKKEVGDYLNPKFVCLKVNAEKGEGVELAKRYAVKAYPTLVVADADGTEKGRFEGMRQPDALKNEIERIVDPSKTPEALKKRYASGERTAELIAAYAALVVDEGMESRSRGNYMKAKEKADSIVQDYYAKLPDADRMKPENMFVYRSYTMNHSDPSTKFIIANLKKFDEPARHEIDSIARFVYDYAIYRWISGSKKFDAAEYAEVKKVIKETGFNADHHFDTAYQLIEEYQKGDKLKFINFCSANYSKLTYMQLVYLTQEYSRLFEGESDEVKLKASRFLRDIISDMKVDDMYWVVLQIRELEGAKH